MNKEEIENLKKAGKIAAEAVKFAKQLVKKDMLLLDIANKIENKIIELGGKPAFPVNLSINEIAAHYTPSFNDTTKASGLLKVDIGVHVEGYAADTAFSIDLENSALNKSLIEAAELALKKGTEIINKNIQLNQIGKAVQEAIESKGFTPIQNLSGHSIERYNLHAGVTIPNITNSSPHKLDLGTYAIEPFSTNGAGQVKDGKPSGIYNIINPKNVRDNFAREVLNWLIEEYEALPFCSRWVYNKFGARGLLALKRIEEAGVLHHFSQLVEARKGIVAQAEHTVLITDKEKVITTN